VRPVPLSAAMRRLRLLACLIGVFAGCGLAATAYGASRICMSADTLSFGQQPVGSSVSSTVVVANCGDAPFTFTDVSRHSATNAAYFTMRSARESLLAGDRVAARNDLDAFDRVLASAKAKEHSAPEVREQHDLQHEAGVMRTKNGL